MGELSHYCALARGQRGRAAAAVVNEALADAHLFVFGELLDVPSIADLASGEKTEQAMHQLLQIFAYGTYNDYLKRQDSLPQLSAPQRHKLKQLSLVSLAATSRILRYDDLLSSLDIGDVRELEDVVIDAITNDLLNARLDQARRHVEVLDCIGRDVRKEEIGKMVDTLTKWYEDSRTVMETLDDLIKQGEKEQQEKVEHARSLAESIDAARVAVKKDLSESDGGRGGVGTMGGGVFAGGGAGDYDMDPVGYGEERGRKKRVGSAKGFTSMMD